MARPLDDRQQRELSEFVNALATAAGYTTTAEWARDSGYPPPNLSNLRNGRGAVDGYNLLRLIRAAAARSDLTTDQLALGLAQATAREATEESVQARLDELTELVTEALRLLHEAQNGARRQMPAAARSGSTKRAAQ
jgi:hypothetical protein